MNAANQNTLRLRMLELLKPYLSGLNDPVQAQFGEDLSQMLNAKVALTMLLGGVERNPIFSGSNIPHAWFYYVLTSHIYVCDVSSDYETTADVEAMLGLVEQRVTDFTADYPRVPGVWDFLQFAQLSSTPVPEVVAKTRYRRREMYLKLRVIGGAG